MFFRTRIGLIGRIFLGCDIVYIRLIRGISGQHNIIHTRIYFFRTLIGRIGLILQVCGTCFIKDKMLDKLLTLNSNNSLCQLVSRQLVYF